MIIGIFGASSVGKSSAARLLAQRRTLPLRACGSLVREVAESLHVSHPEELSDAVHRGIDEETLDWSLRNQPCLVEGRFLDRVLGRLTVKPFLVELRATSAVRQARACSRAGHVVSIEEVKLRDQADVAFRERMYSEQALNPDLRFDTSTCTVQECVDRLILEIAW
jgi:cytidylate kinase